MYLQVELTLYVALGDHAHETIRTVESIQKNMVGLDHFPIKIVRSERTTFTQKLVLVHK